MFNPRKKILGNLAETLRSLQYVLVPNGALTFTRYRVEHTGWIWFVFPRLTLKTLGTIDLRATVQNAVGGVQSSLQMLSEASQKAIRQAVERNAATRAAALQDLLRKKSDKLVLGTQKTPSIIVAKGRTAVQAVHRSMVEAVGKVSTAHFEQTIRKSLVQMLAYAREEAGAAIETEHALPLGTRFVYYGDPVTLYIIEEPPRVRTILWDGKPVQLSFPYVVFPIYFRKNEFEAMQMFFRNEPLQSPEDELFMPTLPDIMEEAHNNNGNETPRLRFRYWVCFPGPKKSKGAPAEVAGLAQQNFWSSNFRSNHWGRSIQHKVENMKGFSIKKWRELTRDEPLSALSIDWRKTPYTVEMLGKDLKRRDGNFDIRASLSRLDQYARELSVRIGSSMQETVLEVVGNAKDVKASRANFDAKLQEALAEVDLAEKLGVLVREALTQASDSAETDTVVAAIAQRASAKLGEIVTPALHKATALVARQLDKPAEG